MVQPIGGGAPTPQTPGTPQPTTGYIDNLNLPPQVERNLRRFMAIQNVFDQVSPNFPGRLPEPLTEDNVTMTQQWGKGYLINFGGSRSIIFRLRGGPNAQPVEFQLGTARQIPWSLVCE